MSSESVFSRPRPTRTPRRKAIGRVSTTIHGSDRHDEPRRPRMNGALRRTAKSASMKIVRMSRMKV